MTTTNETTRPDPRSGGLMHALYTLAVPARFSARAPSLEAVRYDPRARPGIPPLCDVYLPAPGHGGRASVIVVHGGGFVVGHRGMKPVRLAATRLVSEGYAVCAIDYRLLLRGGGLEAQLEDVRVAAAFWRAECARHGCDPARISMLGFSAGAALALLAAGTSTTRYERLVSVYGPADFEHVSGRRAAVLLRAVFGTGDRKVWAERSPARHVATAAPLLVIHGTADALVPVAHAHRLHEARRAQGLPSELALFEGMNHGWLNDASLRETEQALDRIVSFLGKSD